MISFSLMRAGKDITQAPKLGRPKSDTNDSINGPRSYNRTRISEDIRHDNIGHWIISADKRNRYI
ncbi:hypothetical protein BpHYR1_012592 [Brachionus plicatilis]|uniref:Uncharacterized protein n=1 Tax=Brachionus plicatilis TaxID=10195 RepID=A0A3M7T236_BRAPC|nr:hypothetical protein BpHYR1_012592 [Brachionus plicatilis]